MHGCCCEFKSHWRKNFFLLFKTFDVNFVQKCQICVENEKPDYINAYEYSIEIPRATLRKTDKGFHCTRSSLGFCRNSIVFHLIITEIHWSHFFLQRALNNLGLCASLHFFQSTHQGAPCFLGLLESPHLHKFQNG